MAGIQVQFDTRQAQVAARALTGEVGSLGKALAGALSGAEKLGLAAALGLTGAAAAYERETRRIMQAAAARGEIYQQEADAYTAALLARSVVTEEQEAEGTRAVKENAAARAAVLAGYVDATNRLTMNGYAYRRQQLEAWLAAEIAAHGESAELFALYSAKSMQLAEETADYLSGQARRAALAGDDFAAGMAQAFKDLAEDALTFGRAGYDAVKGFADAGEQLVEDVFVAGFEGQIDDLTDAWRSFTDSMVRMFASAVSRMAMENLVLPSVASAFGLGEASGGGFPGFEGLLSRPLWGGQDPLFGQGQGYVSGWEYNAGMRTEAGDTSLGQSGPDLASLLMAGGLGSVLYSLLGLPQSKYSGVGSGLGAAGGFALGSIVGPIGSIIGGVLGALGGGFLSSLFGGDDKPDDLDLTYYGGGTDEKGARKSGRYNYALKAKDFGKDQGHKHEGEALEKATISYLDNYFTGIEDAFDIDLGPLIEKMDFNLNDVQDQINEKHDVPEVMLKKLFKNYLDDWKTALASSDKAYATTLVSGFEDITDQNELKDWLDKAVPAMQLAESIGQSIGGWLQDTGKTLADVLSDLPADEAEKFKTTYGSMFKEKTGLEQAADQVNAEFDAWVQQLQDLGVDDAFIAGIEAMRQDAIDAAQQAMRDEFNIGLDQRELVASGQSGVASKRARDKSQADEVDAAVKQFGEGSTEVARLLAIQAAENDALRQSMEESIAIYAAQVTGNKEGAQWLQLQADHTQKWNEAIAAGVSEEQLDALRTAMEIENQLFAEQQAFAKKERETDLQVRLLRAQGNDEEADALARQLDHERELLEAKQDGWTTEQIAMLQAAQAAEDLQAAADAAAAAAADAEEAFKSMQDMVLDLQGKFLELGFNPSQALQGVFVRLTAAQKQRAELELQLAQGYQSLLESKANQSILAAYGQYENQARQALEAAIALEKRRAMEDLEVRRLTAQGDDDAAEALQKRLDLEREYQDAVDEGRDADYLASLRQAQAYELLEWAQARQAQAVEKLAQAYRDAADSLSDTIRDLTYSEELSTLNPGQKLAKLRSEFEDMSAKALAGDAEAMQSLGGLASQYLEAQRGYYGSSGAYAAEYERVMGILSTARTMAETYAENPLTSDVYAEYSQEMIDQLAEMSGYMQTIASGDQLAQWRDLLHAMGVPGYASGGLHPGGWAVVGERGPELLNLGPARVFDAATTAKILRPVGGDGNREVVSAVNRLTAQFTAYRQQQADEQTALRRQNAALIRENRELRLKAQRADAR